MRMPLLPMLSGNFTNIATSDATAGVYMLNGEAVTVDQIFDLTFADSNFNPATNIDAGGFEPHSNTETDAYLNAAVRDQLYGGFTAVLDLSIAEGTRGTTVGLSISDADYNVNTGAILNWTNDPGNGTFVDRVELKNAAGGSQDSNGVVQTTGIHRLAFTATLDHTAFSLDGADPVTFAGSGIPALAALIYFNIGGNIDSRLRSFAFYDVVDDADLPTLSAL